ncbi:Hsp70 family protein [Actinomadura chokoriensis]|uniref:Hsp70 family protein n=1 Tax=Actinomadura chokoriensis TaxID=454156 RepID=A0ABV4R6A3_9ACTN
MSLIVGIDLGTTNSCIAVPVEADIPGKDRLIADRRLRPFGDALIVTTPDRAPAVPSVVWIGPDGAALVGLRAKHKARNDTHPPARFFKRAMGTDEIVQAGHAELTPVEASAHVLRHLKRMAEETLGVPVERAVITVPAFFETPAKNDTATAGELAGLEVTETLIEPVAAALAYTGPDWPDEPRTFCVYDLGGGTFDTALVTLDPDVGFDCRAFGGDRYLGGYDFDREIVGWLVGRLPGHSLDFDAENPGHRRVLAQLTAVAEEAKHDLSRFAETEIVDEHAVDLAGEPMSINVPISRDEFEALIEPALYATLAHCDRALDKAGMTADQLDDIVMVGGSSRIPAVTRLLAEHLGREPQLLNPDLCVAVGAARKAATAAVRSGNLELDKPDLTPPSTDVSGRVLPGGELGSAGGVTVLLSSDDGMTELEETTDAAGRFLFADVPVDEDSENAFSVRIRASGRDIATCRLVMDRRPGPETDVAGDVLSHDFFIELINGPHRVVPSETRVPYRTGGVTFETARRGTFLSVRIIEDLLPIGDVMVTDLPPDLPEGTPVEITLEFQPDWTIRAEARIPSVNAHATAVIELPRRKTPAWSDLERRIQELRRSWDEKRGTAVPADAVRLGPMLDRHLDEIEALLVERQDRAKTHHKTLEAETLLGRVRGTADTDVTLGPTMEEFRETVEELERAISDLAERDTAAANRHRLEVPKLLDAGTVAYQTGNRLDWHRANEAVIEQLRAVYVKLPMPQISPDELRGLLLQEIERMQRTVTGHLAKVHGPVHVQGNAFIPRLDELLRDAIADGPDDTAHLGRIYRRFRGLKAQIDAWIARIHGDGDTGIKRRDV